MNDLSYIGAAYAVVLGGLFAYAISLVRRGRGAARRLSAIEARRDHPAIRPEVVPAMEPETELDPRSP
jgi:hypothetical protein